MIRMLSSPDSTVSSADSASRLHSRQAQLPGTDFERLHFTSVTRGPREVSKQCLSGRKA